MVYQRNGGSSIEIVLKNQYNDFSSEELKQLCFDLIDYCAFPLLTDPELEAIVLLIKFVHKKDWFSTWNDKLCSWYENWYNSAFHSRAEWLFHNHEFLITQENKNENEI